MTLPRDLDERRYLFWLSLTESHPPEWLAAYTAKPHAPWCVITEDGPPEGRQRRAAYLAEEEDLPYWAFALARAMLDDLGEWPTFGLAAEKALWDLEEHADPVRAVHEILAAVQPVWPDFTVLFAGQEGE